MVNGKRISWDEALNNIASKLEDLRQKDGPDSAMFWDQQNLITSKHITIENLLLCLEQTI